MSKTLAADAIAIWQAGVRAAKPQPLVASKVDADAGSLRVGETTYTISPNQKIYVLAAGKAAPAMAQGFLDKTAALHDAMLGWVLSPGRENRPLGPLRWFGVRPPGTNLPTEFAVGVTADLLATLSSAGPDDILIFLLSGGASATLCAPIPPLSLKEKISVTKRLAAAGATIDELNQVRRSLSRVKGGGLLEAFAGQAVHTLCISDVCGDHPDIIGSGPTVPGRSYESAVEIMQRYQLWDTDSWTTVRTVLKNPPPPAVHSLPAHPFEVIGNNEMAKLHAAEHAHALGYEVSVIEKPVTGMATAAGYNLASAISSLPAGKHCRISGGETTVQLCWQPGKGGRNLHVAAAAMAALYPWPADACLLSAGTDGEDGPTDAAGACVTAAVSAETDRTTLAQALGLQNTYAVFAQNGGLFCPGLTGTNVMDLQIIVTDRSSPERS